MITYNLHKKDHYHFVEGIKKAVLKKKNKYTVTNIKANLSNNRHYSEIKCGCPNVAYIVNKYHLYNRIKDHPFTPDTYIMKNGKLNRPLNSNLTILFLKDPALDFCRGTHVCSTLTECIEISQQNNKSYILQPGISNLLLHLGHKFDVRMFVVIHDGQFKLFKYGFMVVCKNKFEGINRENHLTNLKGNYNKIDFDEKLEHYKIMIDKMQSVVSNLQNIYNGYFDRKNTVLLLGFDFIFDTTFNIYLLEINYYPYYDDVYYKNLLCDHLLSDVYEPLIAHTKMFDSDVWLN
jgi:hypothetical protein